MFSVVHNLAAAPDVPRPAEHRVRMPFRALQAINEPDDVVATSHGVLSPAQASLRPECGRRLRTGAWLRYGAVVVTHNGPLTSEQDDWVALLRCGDGAVLAALTAMRRLGVRCEPPPRPQVVVPAWRSAPRVPGVDVRRSRLLGPQEVHPVRQPPVMRLTRATLDAASLARSTDDVRAMLCLPVQQRVLRVPELRTALLRLGPLPGRALILRTLADLELGAQSVHEQAFARLVRDGGLPEPDRQVLREHPGGRRYLDVAWLTEDAHVEIDGLAHMWVERWLDDMHRSNELEILRPQCRLRFPGHLLLEQGSLVLDQLRRALAVGGRRG